MLDEIVVFLTSLGLYSSVLFFNLFVVLYSWLARWWRTPGGRHLFCFMLSATLIIDHSILVRIIGEYPGIEYSRMVLYNTLAVVSGWRVILLIDAQVIRRRKSREDNRYRAGQVSRIDDSHLDHPVIPHSQVVE